MSYIEDRRESQPLTSPAVKHHLRYWGFLLLKLTGAALGSACALWFLNLLWLPRTPFFHLNKFQFGYDLLYTTLAGVWFLFSYGLFYLAIWDQLFGSFQNVAAFEGQVGFGRPAIPALPALFAFADVNGSRSERQ